MRRHRTFFEHSYNYVRDVVFSIAQRAWPIAWPLFLLSFSLLFLPSIVCHCSPHPANSNPYNSGMGFDPSISTLDLLVYALLSP